MVRVPLGLRPYPTANVSGLTEAEVSKLPATSLSLSVLWPEDCCAVQPGAVRYYRKAVRYYRIEAVVLTALACCAVLPAAFKAFGRDPAESTGSAPPVHQAEPSLCSGVPHL